MTFTQESLGFRRTGISPVFSCTYTCILSSTPSSYLSRPPSSVCGMLPYQPYQKYDSVASVYRLAPLHCLRMTTRPVSYYALFEGMAASKPTSWLSSQSHIILHLAVFRDLSQRSGLFPSRLRTLSPAVSLPYVVCRHSEFGWVW
jgi:hypothetical protein